MYIFGGTCLIIFAPACLLLVVEDRDDSSSGWMLLAEVCLVNDSPELDDGAEAEDGVVWVADVYHIECYCFRPLRTSFAECHIQLYFADGLNLFATEADNGVLGLV